MQLLSVSASGITTSAIMAAIDGDSWFYEKLSKWPHDDDDIILLSTTILLDRDSTVEFCCLRIRKHEFGWWKLSLSAMDPGWCGRWASSTSLRCSVESRWINQRWRRGGRCQRMNQGICVGGFMNRWSTPILFEDSTFTTHNIPQQQPLANSADHCPFKGEVRHIFVKYWYVYL